MCQFVQAQMIAPKRLYADREYLARESHKKKCAKHRGRNHLTNWMRKKLGWRRALKKI